MELQLFSSPAPDAALQTGFEFPVSLTEKYRPRALDQFVGLDKVKKIAANLERARIDSEHPDTDEHRAGCSHCQYVHDSKLPDAPDSQALTAQQWGEGRRAFILTDAQCDLIADALEIINPDDDEIEKQARAMAIQFRSEDN